jgi:hypothetical protein
MELAPDNERLAGVTVIGGKQLTAHAVIRSEEGPMLYCQPDKRAEAVDYGINGLVTCSVCKAKLRIELSHE